MAEICHHRGSLFFSVDFKPSPTHGSPPPRRKLQKLPRAFAAALLEKSMDTSPDVPPPPAARVTSAGTAGQRRRCRLRGFHGMRALGCAKMMLG